MDPAGPRAKETHDFPHAYDDLEKHSARSWPSDEFPDFDESAGSYKSRHGGRTTTRRRLRLGRAFSAGDMLLWRRYPSWALPALLTFCIALLSWPATAPAAATDPPRKSNGLTDVVQWDNYTLFLHDQRMFLQYVFHWYAQPPPNDVTSFLL